MAQAASVSNCWTADSGSCRAAAHKLTRCGMGTSAAPLGRHAAPPSCTASSRSMPSSCRKALRSGPSSPAACAAASSACSEGHVY